MTGNQLKIIALLTMTVDHIGAYLFPQVVMLRIIGRLSFPIFAYMVAEGCHYTHDKLRYLLGFVAVGALCQVVYFVVMHSLEQSIMTTLAAGVITIYGMQCLGRRRDWLGVLALVGALTLDILICELPAALWPELGYRVDYGLPGILLPAFAYAPRLVFADANDPRLRAAMLASSALGLVWVALWSSSLQWFGLAALALLATYNGERGTWNLKYLFYAYYPLHLAAIFLVGLVLPL